MFSPDARRIAYTSDDAGQLNVYVQPFPEGGPRYQVSRDGGGHVAWRADGKEMFFVAPDGRMMAVPIDTSGEFRAGVPQPLFAAIPPSSLSLNGLQYEVTNDGKRFLVIARPDRASVAPVTVVVNWAATIRR